MELPLEPDLPESERDLKLDHPDLYNRVRIKAVVHTLLGLALIFTPPLEPSQAKTTLLTQLFNLTALGLVFLLIGLGIFFGLSRPRNNYRLAKFWLAVGAGHAMVWWLALVLAAVSGRNPAPSIIVLWGYWTYNLYKIASDPGWSTIQALKQLREDGNGVQ